MTRMTYDKNWLKLKRENIIWIKIINDWQNII